MAVDHLVTSFILLLISNTGFSAEISVFVQMGDSVQLDIQTHELSEFNILFWTNDKSENIVVFIHGVKVNPHSSYKNRVDFNDETFSLTLKNMQKTDSGLYTARTSGESERIIAKYRVSVIDAVEAPVLTVNSIRSSSDSCTVNFTCRAHDLMINSSYQNNSCSPEEVTSHEIYTLILYCSEESIICNHSNPVSSKKDRIEIKQLCVNNKENVPRNNQTNQNQTLLVWLFIPLGVCLLLAIFLCFKCKKGVQEADNTVYAQVETQEMQKTNSDANTYDVPEQVQEHTQEETGDNQPNTMYCTVGQHQKPADPPETERTIYAVVFKQPKPTTTSSDDA